MIRPARSAVGLVLAAAGIGAPTAAAQRAQTQPALMRWRPSLRADAIIDRHPGAQFALGIATPVTYNVRLGVDVGFGGVQRPPGWQTAGRVELLARWLSDPFRESRWGIHAGGGVGLRVESGQEGRMLAIVTLGVDGPSDGTWVPGVEVGLGGGVRAGLTLRRAPIRRR